MGMSSRSSFIELAWPTLSVVEAEAGTELILDILAEGGSGRTFGCRVARYVKVKLCEGEAEGRTV